MSEPQSRRVRPQVARISLAVALVTVVLDQITKRWAINTLSDGHEIHVFWTLQFNLAFNTGMAFGKGTGFGPVIALLALLVVIVLIISAAHIDSLPARIAAGMLIGGALGNLLDRMFRGDRFLRGGVVDFIDFQWWPIFNVADIGVTVGAVIFALSSLRSPRPPREQEAAA